MLPSNVCQSIHQLRFLIMIPKLPITKIPNTVKNTDPFEPVIGNLCDLLEEVIVLLLLIF